MLKFESAGSESAQVMRNDSEVHYGYLTASLPCCLAELFPGTLPAPGIIIRTELRSMLSGFKSLNDLNSPCP